MKYLIFVSNIQIGNSLKRYLNYNNKDADVITFSNLNKKMIEIEHYDVIITDVYENKNGLLLSTGLQYSYTYSELRELKKDDNMITFVFYYNTQKLEIENKYDNYCFFLPLNIREFLLNIIGNFKKSEDLILRMMEIFKSSGFTTTHK